MSSETQKKSKVQATVEKDTKVYQMFEEKKKSTETWKYKQLKEPSINTPLG